MSQIRTLKQALPYEADNAFQHYRYYRADQVYDSSRVLFETLTANRQRHNDPPRTKFDLQITHYGAIDLGSFALLADGEQSETVRRLVAVPYEYRSSYTGLHLLGIKALKLCNQPRDSNYNTQEVLLDLTIPAADDEAYPNSQWGKEQRRYDFIQFAGFITEVLVEAEQIGQPN